MSDYLQNSLCIHINTGSYRALPVFTLFTVIMLGFTCI